MLLRALKYSGFQGPIWPYYNMPCPEPVGKENQPPKRMVSDYMPDENELRRKKWKQHKLVGRKRRRDEEF